MWGLFPRFAETLETLAAPLAVEDPFKKVKVGGPECRTRSEVPWPLVGGQGGGGGEQPRSF